MDFTTRLVIPKCSSAAMMPAFNQRPFKRQPNSSRYSLFMESELPALQPLPLHLYEHADWR